MDFPTCGAGILFFLMATVASDGLLTVLRGQSVTLQTGAQYPDASSVQWTHNKRVIVLWEQGELPSYHYPNLALDVITLSLTISDLQKNCSGLYEMEINDMDKISYQIVVHEAGPRSHVMVGVSFGALALLTAFLLVYTSWKRHMKSRKPERPVIPMDQKRPELENNINCRTIQEDYGNNNNTDSVTV